MTRTVLRGSLTLLVLGSAACALLRPWNCQGVGAALTPWQLSGKVLAGDDLGLIPRWAGFVPLLPAIVAASWLSGFAFERYRRQFFAFATLLCVVCLLGLDRIASVSDYAWGGWALVVLSLASGAGVVLELVPRSLSR